MHAFEMTELAIQRAQQGKAYLEFLRVPSMSLGVYHLPVGAHDQQLPHSEDEVYYIVSGKAKITVSGEVRSVQEGSIVYVAAYDEHRFHDIKEDLTIIVFFSPAEHANQASD